MFFVAILFDGSMVGCGGWSFRKALYAGPSISPHENTNLDLQKYSARIRAMFIAPLNVAKELIL